MILTLVLTIIDFNYKTYSGSSQYNFGILAKIVKHMKVSDFVYLFPFLLLFYASLFLFIYLFLTNMFQQRHLNGDTYPLTLEEILDETNQLDIGTRQRAWLINEVCVIIMLSFLTIL